MITRLQVKIELKKAGVYLSAKTKKTKFGKCYNTEYPKAENYVATIDEAIKDFLGLFNDFEK